LLQGALGDELGLRATTAGGAILLALSLVVVRLARPGFDRELADIAPRSDTVVIAAAE